MSRANTPSTIDRLCARRDFQALYEVISVTSRSKRLPVECWVFCRLWEWHRSGKSSLWQYYDGMPPDDFDQISRALDRLGFAALVGRYREGMAVREDADLAAGVNKWMVDHNRDVEQAMLSLIAGCRESLADES